MDGGEPQVLDQRECFRLLRDHTGGVGRVGFHVDAMPTILPVNYAMACRDVVFLTGRGLKATATDTAVVAFEVDGIDLDEGTAWSVLVRGIAAPVDASEVRGAGGEIPESIVAQPGDTLVRVRSAVVTGRRFSLAGVPGREPASDV